MPDPLVDDAGDVGGDGLVAPLAAPEFVLGMLAPGDVGQRDDGATVTQRGLAHVDNAARGRLELQFGVVFAGEPLHAPLGQGLRVAGAVETGLG